MNKRQIIVIPDPHGYVAEWLDATHVPGAELRVTCTGPWRKRWRFKRDLHALAKGKRKVQRNDRGWVNMEETEQNFKEGASLDYLKTVPRPGDIPSGLIVVHNHVRSTRRLGSRGFRAWVAMPAVRYVPCDCGWAPELGGHYRVNSGLDGKHG